MTLRRRIALAALMLAPVVVLAIALRDFVRAELIGPVLYVYWVVRLFVESFPQLWTWAVFIIFATILVARGFATRPSLPQTRPPEAVEHGHVETLARLIHQARRDTFARWRLAQRLGGLVGDILANQERVSRREIWRRLDRGRLNVPAPLRAYLTAQLRSVRPSGVRGLLPHSSPLDLDPREVVQFLEDRLRSE